MIDNAKKNETQKNILKEGEKRTSKILKMLLKKSIDNIKNKEK